MHYYQKNIADYRKDTGHLTLLEHGIYNQVIDSYYLDEKPIKTQSVIRRLRIETPEELSALDDILNDFFSPSECGEFWVHKRIDREIAKYKARAETAKANGSKGGRPSKPKKTQSVILANPKETGSKANQEPLTINHKPIKDNSQESKIPPCPHEKIIDLYHKILPELQSVNKTLWKGSKREKDLTARWRQNEEFRKSEFWTWYFQSVKQSAFHMGENDRHWKADLGWLVKKENFIKMVEKYSG